MTLAAPISPARRVLDYARDVSSGRVLANKLVINACERHLRDLDQGHERGLRFDEQAAERALKFFSLLRQSKGRWRGERLALLDWQCFVIGAIFGWKRWDEELELEVRRFKRAWVEIARKNGKTTIGAGFGLYLLDYDDEAGAEVYAAATKRDQARQCWDEAEAMVGQTEALSRHIRPIHSTATMSVRDTGSKFKALSADSKKDDGLNPSGAIIDEVHAHRDRTLIDKLETGIGARTQPLFLYITTAGPTGESVYAEEHIYAQQVLDGALEDDELFAVIYSLDPDDDWTDEANYGKANPSLGETVQLSQLIAERDRAIAVPGRAASFKMLRLNVRSDAAARWINIADWNACAGDETIEEMRTRLKGAQCYAGLDLASTTDVAALVLFFPETYDVLCFFYCPESRIDERSQIDRVPYRRWAEEGILTATPGNITDYNFIEEDYKLLGEEFDIVELAYDRWNATQLITNLQNDGANCVPFGQGYGSLSAPTKELEKLTIGHLLRHGGNAVLRWMAGNVVVQKDSAENLKPVRDKSADKIDGIVALIMAIGRAALPRAGKEWHGIYIPSDEEETA